MISKFRENPKTDWLACPGDLPMFNARTNHKKIEPGHPNYMAPADLPNPIESKMSYHYFLCREYSLCTLEAEREAVLELMAEEEG